MGSRDETDNRLKQLLNKKDPPPPRRTRRKKKVKGPTVDLELLPYMSESELVEIARLAGYSNASRQLLPEDLIALILGELPEEPADSLEQIRERIFDFVDGNQRILRSQMTCDLYCPTCPHNKVVECYVVNRDKVG
jgi:hypothetical protein